MTLPGRNVSQRDAARSTPSAASSAIACACQFSKLRCGAPGSGRVCVLDGGARRPNSSNTARSEEPRVGKECVRTCRSRCSPYNSTTKSNTRTVSQDKYNTINYLCHHTYKLHTSITRNKHQ